MQKAQAIDPAGDAYNEQIDAATREHALAQREQCYEIIISALRSLKGDTSQREFGSPVRPASATSFLDQSSRKKYICQIVQLGVQSPDRIFHEYLYRAMIDLGLENELLEYGGPDLVPFLQSAGREPIQEVLIFFFFFLRACFVYFGSDLKVLVVADSLIYFIILIAYAFCNQLSISLKFSVCTAASFGSYFHVSIICLVGSSCFCCDVSNFFYGSIRSTYPI